VQGLTGTKGGGSSYFMIEVVREGILSKAIIIDIILIIILISSVNL
jgi:hypothetical protein